jgi:branched-chain amino acid transport system substrate-binding protein
MHVNRRQFLKGTAAAAATVALPSLARPANAIQVGSILDTSGIFDAYGKPMDQAATLAIEEINAAGGLNGQKLEKVAYDTQSDMALYTQYAQQLARRDRVDVVHGGILSASREAIRPTLRRHKVLYFYNVQYEGGVCDRNVFCTGITPAQQVEVLVPYAMKKWGKKVYILAADYNYGQITAKWVTHHVRKNGGQVVQADFFPLDVADFGATITKVQEAKPDIVMSALVGGAHLSFYRQWAAAGMKQRIPMASTTIGAGNEHVVLTPEEGNGILVVYNYSRDHDTPANRVFLERWGKRFGNVNTIHEIAVSNYQGIKLWAEGVKKAGTHERMKVIEALETGIGIDGPAGRITIDPQTHHVVLDTHIMEFRNQKMVVLESLSQRQPVDTQGVCDLKKNPEDTTQYEIDI